MSIIPAYGAYSQANYFLCRSIVSSYEEHQVLDCIRQVDPRVLLYTQKVDHFYGISTETDRVTQSNLINQNNNMPD